MLLLNICNQYFLTNTSDQLRILKSAYGSYYQLIVIHNIISFDFHT